MTIKDIIMGVALSLVIIAALCIAQLAFSADVVLKPGQSTVIGCEAAPTPEPSPVPVPSPSPVPVPSPSPTPVPPVPVPPTNGAQKLFSDDFESGDFTRWSSIAKQAKVTVEKVHNGNFAVIADQSSFGWGGELQKSFTSQDQVYIQFYWFIPNDFDAAWASGRHLFRLGSSGNAQLDTEPGDGKLKIVSFWSRELLFSSTVANGLPRGRWFKFGLFYKLNTVGSSDGVLRIWVDGTLTFDKVGQTFRSNSDQISRLRLVTNYDNCSDKRCRYFMDDVEIWNDVPNN